MSSPNEKYSLQYKLKTEVSQEGLITQGLQCGKTFLWKEIMDTREKAIEHALVKLGWIPPGKIKEACATAYWYAESTGDYEMKDLNTSDIFVYKPDHI